LTSGSAQPATPHMRGRLHGRRPFTSLSYHSSSTGSASRLCDVMPPACQHASETVFVAGCMPLSVCQSAQHRPGALRQQELQPEFASSTIQGPAAPHAAKWLAPPARGSEPAAPPGSGAPSAVLGAYDEPGAELDVSAASSAAARLRERLAAALLMMRARSAGNGTGACCLRP